MRVGFFATLVDQIQRAYGWTDDIVLNLTVRRALQMHEAIKQREEIERWENYRLIEWQTKNIAIAAVQGVWDNDARKDLMESFNKLSLDGSSSDTSTKRKKKATVYRTKDGKEISKKDLSKYSYEEIDHTTEEKRRVAAARAKNAGTSLADLSGSFSRSS